MTAIAIKSMSSPDVEVEVWEPESRADVYFLVELEIGPVAEQGADLFQLVVATPEGLRKRGRGEVISSRGTLVLADFSWEVLRRALEGILAECTRSAWNESVLALQRYFRWEYEDHQVS